MKFVLFISCALMGMEYAGAQNWFASAIGNFLVQRRPSSTPVRRPAPSSSLVLAVAPTEITSTEFVIQYSTIEKLTTVTETETITAFIANEGVVPDMKEVTVTKMMDPSTITSTVTQTSMLTALMTETVTETLRPYDRNCPICLLAITEEDYAAMMLQGYPSQQAPNRNNYYNQPEGFFYGPSAFRSALIESSVKDIGQENEMN